MQDRLVYETSCASNAPEAQDLEKQHLQSIVRKSDACALPMVHDRRLASSNMCIAFYPFKGWHSTGSNSSMDRFAQQPGRGLIVRLTRGDVGPEIVRGH